MICKKEEKSKIVAKTRRRAKNLKTSDSNSVSSSVSARPSTETSSSDTTFSGSNIMTQHTKPSINSNLVSDISLLITIETSYAPNFSNTKKLLDIFVKISNLELHSI